MQLQHPAPHMNTMRTDNVSSQPIAQSKSNGDKELNLANTLENTYASIDNTNEAVGGTIATLMGAVRKAPRILNFASKAVAWLEESAVGTALGKIGIPVLAGIKTISAADAINDGDGHRLARTAGSFAAAIAAVGIAAAGLAAASTAGVVVGAAIGIGVIGLNLLSDSAGEEVMDMAYGKDLQAGMDARSRQEIAKLRQRAQDVAQPQGKIDATYHGELWAAATGITNMLDKRSKLELPASDREGIQRRTEDIDALKEQLAQLTTFRSAHAQELASIPSVHTIAPKSINDSNHGKDKEALAMLKPGTPALHPDSGIKEALATLKPQIKNGMRLAEAGEPTTPQVPSIKPHGKTTSHSHST